MDEENTLLGRVVAAPGGYAPEVLQAIDRQSGRRLLGLEDKPLPFHGADQWTVFELAWLDISGRPQVGIAEIDIPCASPCTVESKSLKFYFQGLNNHRFASLEVLEETIKTDISGVCQSPIGLQIDTIDDYARKGLGSMAGISLDTQDVDLVGMASQASPQADRLSVDMGSEIVTETLHSHLFRSNCPVTGQPDWASLQLSYRGQALRRESLLQYLLSYREHRGFHEQCVEQIFLDVLEHCRPQALTVAARFTRRGGIDINPWRSTHATPGVLPERQGRQ